MENKHKIKGYDTSYWIQHSWQSKIIDNITACTTHTTHPPPSFENQKGLLKTRFWMTYEY